jgi:hypothetical protein
MFSWLWQWLSKDSTGRTGHGVTAGVVVEEVTAGGFTLVKVIEDWPGRGPLKSYCAIFRKPEAFNDGATLGKPDTADARLNLGDDVVPGVTREPYPSEYPSRRVYATAARG